MITIAIAIIALVVLGRKTETIASASSRPGIAWTASMTRWSIMSSRPVAGDETDEHAHDRADSDREEPDPQGDATSVDDATQDVAPDVVRAEGMGPARRRQPNLGLRSERIVRRDDIGKRGRERQQHDDPGRRDAERVAPERGDELTEPALALGDGLAGKRGGARDGQGRLSGTGCADRATRT